MLILSTTYTLFLKFWQERRKKRRAWYKSYLKHLLSTFCDLLTFTETANQNYFRSAILSTSHVLMSDIWSQTSDVRCLNSVVRSLMSHVWYDVRRLISDIWYQTSDIRHHTSHIRRLTSNIYHTSDVCPLSWNVWHQMSAIRQMFDVRCLMCDVCDVWNQMSDSTRLKSDVWSQMSDVRRLMLGVWSQTSDVTCLTQAA